MIPTPRRVKALPGWGPPNDVIPHRQDIHPVRLEFAIKIFRGYFFFRKYGPDLFFYFHHQIFSESLCTHPARAYLFLFGDDTFHAAGYQRSNVG
jgi:hypothetical protein